MTQGPTRNRLAPRVLPLRKPPLLHLLPAAAQFQKEARRCLKTVLPEHRPHWHTALGQVPFRGPLTLRVPQNKWRGRQDHRKFTCNQRSEAGAGGTGLLLTLEKKAEPGPSRPAHTLLTGWVGNILSSPQQRVFLFQLPKAKSCCGPLRDEVNCSQTHT